MNAVKEIRTESREYEALASDLSGKSYKTSIEKLKFALEDIRKERELNKRRKWLMGKYANAYYNSD